MNSALQSDDLQEASFGAQVHRELVGPSRRCERTLDSATGRRAQQQEGSTPCAAPLTMPVCGKPSRRSLGSAAWGTANQPLQRSGAFELDALEAAGALRWYGLQRRVAPHTRSCALIPTALLLAPVQRLVCCQKANCWHEYTRGKPTANLGGVSTTPTGTLDGAPCRTILLR